MRGGEELRHKHSDVDACTLEELCERSAGLIRQRALRMAVAYNCVRRDDHGQQSAYTKETLSELESVGMLAFIECVRSGRYNDAQGALTTYAVPFIDGAMRRYLERNLGTLSLDRESMQQVRRSQRLYRKEGKTAAEIAAELGVAEWEAARHVSYPTHFFSVYDLANPDDGNDVFDYIAEDTLAAPPDEIIYRRVRMECLRELFDALPTKDKDILGKCYGAFGFSKLSIHEIAMYHMMKEDAVEKARNRALKKLRDAYPGSRMQLWDTVHRLMRRPIPPSEVDVELRVRFPQYVRVLAEGYGIISEAADSE